MTLSDTKSSAPSGSVRNASSYYSRFNRSLVRWLPAVLIVIAILGGWEAYARIADVESWLLPAPSEIAATFGRDLGLLSRHAWVTLEEVVIGFGLALTGGVLLAAGISLSRNVERAIYPFVIAAPTIPWLVVAPVLLIWFGHGMAPKIIVVALISFFPIVVTTVDGLRSVDPDSVSLIRTLGASRWQIFLKVQAPSSLPFLFSGAKVAIAVSVIGAIVGEWVGSSEGLGYLMIRSKSQFLTERVFAAIVISSAMGVGLFTLMGLAERLAIPWWYSARRQNRADEFIGDDTPPTLETS